MNYPIRCKIVDVVDHPDSDAAKVFDAVGVTLNTPDVSKPHIGKEGLAEETDKGVRITLNDGTIIWGSQCWWEPMKESARRS